VTAPVRKARSEVAAIDAGRAWADREARDPGSLKRIDRPFFWCFEEAAHFVAPDAPDRERLVFVVGEAACERWRELSPASDTAREDEEPLAWTRRS